MKILIYAIYEYTYIGIDNVMLSITVTVFTVLRVFHLKGFKDFLSEGQQPVS